jgi:hypothetical protein
MIVVTVKPNATRTMYFEHASLVGLVLMICGAVLMPLSTGYGGRAWPWFMLWIALLGLVLLPGLGK